MTIIFLKLGFSPCNNEQPQPGMKLHEKEIKDDSHRENLLRNISKKKMCLLTPDYKPFRS